MEMNKLVDRMNLIRKLFDLQKRAFDRWGMRDMRCGLDLTTSTALIAILKSAAKIDGDDAAREFIVSFELTDGLSDANVDQLVGARFEFAAVRVSVRCHRRSRILPSRGPTGKKWCGISASLSLAGSLNA